MTFASAVAGKALIGPSLMCADPGDLRREVRELDAAGVDYFHFDVMDGHFVPNLAMSADVVRSVREASAKPFDVHLMLSDPGALLGRFIESGADSITIHIEAVPEPRALLCRIHSAGKGAGLAFNPGTPVSAIEPFLGEVDLVCLMSVKPGFAGQKFIPSVLPKLEELGALVARRQLPVALQVDGNVGMEWIPKLLERGASLLVAGTSNVFRKGGRPAEEAVKLRREIEALSIPPFGVHS